MDDVDRLQSINERTPRSAVAPDLWHHTLALYRGSAVVETKRYRIIENGNISQLEILRRRATREEEMHRIREALRVFNGHLLHV